MLKKKQKHGDYDINKGLFSWPQTLVAACVLFPSSQKLISNLKKEEASSMGWEREPFFAAAYIACDGALWSTWLSNK